MEFEDEQPTHSASTTENLAHIGLGLGLVFEAPMLVSEVAETLGARISTTAGNPLESLAGNALNTAYHLAPLVGIIAVMAAGFRMMFGRNRNSESATE